MLAQLIDGPSHPARGVLSPARTRLGQPRARRVRGQDEGGAPRSAVLASAARVHGRRRRPPTATGSHTSLNQPTGPRRKLAVVRADLAAVRAAAHRHGATANNAVLVAVAGALHHVLVTRGEPLSKLLVTVPVSGRHPGGEAPLGNMVSPMLVSVLATGGVPDRLRRVAAQVRAHKQAATGPPPISVLAWSGASVGGARRLPLVHGPPASVPHAGLARAGPCRAGHLRRMPDHLGHPGRRGPWREHPGVLRGAVLRGHTRQ